MKNFIIMFVLVFALLWSFDFIGDNGKLTKQGIKRIDKGLTSLIDSSKDGMKQLENYYKKFYKE